MGQLMNYLTLIIIVYISMCFEIASSDEVQIVDSPNAFSNETLLHLMRGTVPCLKGTRKGDAGRIVVIGGSVEYTGAPYFAAISALKVGADIVFVITTKAAAPVIKSYSPELIVYPYLDEPEALNIITPLLKRKDAIVIGPGLGTNEDIHRTVGRIITFTNEENIPLVIDADGLWVVSKNLNLIRNYNSSGVILTPNRNELRRLTKVLPDYNITRIGDIGSHVYILEKDEYDQFISGNSTFEWSLNLGGSGRRAGGQGDVLSGMLATFYSWAMKKPALDAFYKWDTILDPNDGRKSMLAASMSSFGAAKLTRVCNEKAFREIGRGLTASDMIKLIPSAFNEYFEVNC